MLRLRLRLVLSELEEDRHADFPSSFSKFFSSSLFFFLVLVFGYFFMKNIDTRYVHTV